MIIVSHHLWLSVHLRGLSKDDMGKDLFASVQFTGNMLRLKQLRFYAHLAYAMLSNHIFYVQFLGPADVNPTTSIPPRLHFLKFSVEYVSY